MTIDEYFGDWMRVIDKTEAMKIMGWLKTVNTNLLCPSIRNVFRAFELCPYRELKAVFIGQDPYSQKGVATGILFGNKPDVPEDKLSPSLQVIKEAVINYEIPHYGLRFDNTLESWAKQGILMINSALTCNLNQIGSDVMIWRPFITKLLKNLSENDTAIIYVLFGKQAQTLRPYINSRSNYIIEIEHPAYFARTKTKMPYSVFIKVNSIVKNLTGVPFVWYDEI